jgi:hypothetical protein
VCRLEHFHNSISVTCSIVVAANMIPHDALPQNSFMQTPKLQYFLQLKCNSRKTAQGTHLHTILHSTKWISRGGTGSKFYIMCPEWLSSTPFLQRGIFSRAQMGANLGRSGYRHLTLLQTIDLDGHRALNLYIPKAPPG